ncbi:hypothetical protein [Sphingomonas sp.]|uniref:hypothetical protein n=1 Tax=Sphingomonas sp. TaxID=28214 RepID=UPI0037515B1B
MVDMLTPRSPRWPILGTALMVGSVSFAIGFIGPVLVSDSNLGPLLGIFITGPLGLLAGVLAGIILSARQQGQPTLKRELRWLAGAWAGALFFTWASTIVGIGWVAIGAQLAVVSCAGSLFYGFSAKLPAWARRSRPFILIGAALTLLSSIYPPLDPASVGDARYAFFLDPRFDASKNVPE